MPSPRPWPWRLPGVLTGLTGLTIVALLGGAPCAAAADRDPAAKTLTLNAALSNQTHRGLRPYQIALTRRFGTAFAQAHFVAEGRRACWSARGATECAYARFHGLHQGADPVRGLDPAADARLSDIIETVRNPCRWIDEAGVRAVRAGYFARAGSEDAARTLRHYIRPLDECVSAYRHESFRIVPVRAGTFEIEMVMHRG